MYCVLQGLVLNIFLNYLLLFIKNPSLHNYTNNTTLSFAIDIHDLIEIVTDESQKTIDWMKLNQMIINNFFNKSKSFKPCLSLKGKIAYPET